MAPSLIFVQQSQPSSLTLQRNSKEFFTVFPTVSGLKHRPALNVRLGQHAKSRSPHAMSVVNYELR